NDRNVYSYVDQGHCNYADNYGFRDRAARLWHFIADITGVVVAQIVEDPNPRSPTEAQKKAQQKVKSTRRKIEDDSGIKVERTGSYDCKGCKNSSNPQTHS